MSLPSVFVKHHQYCLERFASGLKIFVNQYTMLKSLATINNNFFSVKKIVINAVPENINKAESKICWEEWRNKQSSSE